MKRVWQNCRAWWKARGVAQEHMNSNLRSHDWWTLALVFSVIPATSLLMGWSNRFALQGDVGLLKPAILILASPFALLDIPVFIVTVFIIIFIIMREASIRLPPPFSVLVPWVNAWLNYQFDYSGNIVKWLALNSSASLVVDSNVWVEKFDYLSFCLSLWGIFVSLVYQYKILQLTWTVKRVPEYRNSKIWLDYSDRSFNIKGLVIANLRSLFASFGGSRASRGHVGVDDRDGIGAGRDMKSQAPRTAENIAAGNGGFPGRRSKFEDKDSLAEAVRDGRSQSRTEKAKAKRMRKLARASSRRTRRRR